jgi:hypothetical protein
MFQHHLRMESGRSATEVVADIVRRMRAAYRLARRRVKRNEPDLANDRFARAMLENRS